jgi:transposase-like protein
MEQKGRGVRGPGSHYSPEERAAAVQIVRESPSKSIREIAAELRINDKTLNGWVVAARNAQIDPAGSMPDTARRRIRELEAENARLRKDLDFERKAQAFIRAISLRRNGSR